MHKKTLKRSTFNSATQKIKAPDHLSRIQDHEDNHNESISHFQLPSLQKKKSWKDDDGKSSWDQNSTATSVSWSPDMENVATCKLIQQWEAVERTLYDDGDPVSQTSVLEECMQWRTQIPHLRIIGKNPFCSVQNRFQDVNTSYDKVKHTFEQESDKIRSGHSFSSKNRKGLSIEKATREDVFDIIFEYVISELFPNKENETDSLCEDLSGVLKIRPAPVYSNKSSAKSTKLNWLGETNLGERFSSSKSRIMDDLEPIGNEMAKTSAQKVHNKAKSLRIENNSSLTTEDRPQRPQMGRNKLGTVFTEKIVVSPVPYVLSTRESFSTLRTTPIKFMGQSLEVSAFRGSGRNISCFKNSAKKSTAIRISNCQSAWHAPVSPAVWPKNVKLAPIDTSRLPSSKNRSLAPSPAVLHRSRKPLSPISRSTLPASAHIVRNSSELLEVRGKHIVPGQSPKLGVFSAGWDYSPRVAKNKKKKSRSKEEMK